MHHKLQITQRSPSRLVKTNSSKREKKKKINDVKTAK